MRRHHRKAALVASACLASSALLLAGCSGADTPSNPTTADGPGPADLGYPLSSTQVAKPGDSLGWGLVTIANPTDKTLTLLDAKPVTEPAAAALEPAYAVGWPRASGSIQWTAWPPTDTELGAEPTELPQIPVTKLDIDGANPGVEIIVGIKVPDGGALMTGVDVSYTDGTTTWTSRVAHVVRICTSGTLDACPMPTPPAS